LIPFGLILTNQPQLWYGKADRTRRRGHR
jgi:hypothetical protein